jgi:hypothetical protein
MRERRACEFFLLRYVPDAVKDEFVNVGVVLLEQGGPYAEVRFTRDWRRVRCLDPEADVAMLESLEEEIRERMLEGGGGQRWLMERMQDTFSNAVRLTAAKAVLAESPQEELGRLAEMYLERPRRTAKAAGGRTEIFRAMQREFVRQGVWEAMRHPIAAREYTRKGDPLKIDAGFRPNGVLHMYHALSLTTDVNAAKGLAFSYPRLREGVQRLEGAETALTAIVESEFEDGDEESLFARETLRESGIHVAGLSEMPGIAESVRQRMGM